MNDKKMQKLGEKDSIAMTKNSKHKYVAVYDKKIQRLAEKAGIPMTKNSKNKHLVVYKNNDELVEKIKYYLDNENERKLIENQGYKFVKENHTYFQRAKQIINIAETLL